MVNVEEIDKGLKGGQDGDANGDDPSEHTCELPHNY